MRRRAQIDDVLVVDDLPQHSFAALPNIRRTGQRSLEVGCAIGIVPALGEEVVGDCRERKLAHTAQSVDHLQHKAA